jgi:CubicO group peptidase (beta-lactamase class C family)
VTGPGFEDVARTFFRLVSGTSGGGALVVRQRGETVVDLSVGWADRARTRPFTAETLALSFSTTKGIASTVLHRLADRGLLAYDDPVAKHWPEFAAGGKERVTIRHLMSHRAGLHDVRAVARNADELLDHLLMEERLAARAVQAPTERSAYHAITYGWLVAGLARRITGKGLADLAREEIVEPLGLDGMHIGVPDDARERVAQPVGGGLRTLASADRVLNGLTRRLPFTRATVEALVAPGFHEIFEGSAPTIWTTEMPAVNGAVNADSLARMYGAIADEGGRLLTPSRAAEIGRVQVRSRDMVLGIPMRWRLGYHQAFGTGSARAFGHYGYGGSGGWADPDAGLSLGFVTNRVGSMTTPMADATLYRLSRVVRRCAA